MLELALDRLDPELVPLQPRGRVLHLLLQLEDPSLISPRCLLGLLDPGVDGVDSLRQELVLNKQGSLVQEKVEPRARQVLCLYPRVHRLQQLVPDHPQERRGRVAGVGELVEQLKGEGNTESLSVCLLCRREIRVAVGCWARPCELFELHLSEVAAGLKLLVYAQVSEPLLEELRRVLVRDPPLARRLQVSQHLRHGDGREARRSLRALRRRHR
mmetsp:Transcript_3755/g.13451  ORF Transcript_3755/g.13451 Transcript_3755/m.13451 type:complete len:214 (-) Transcript_3755:686-1327(-)